MITSQMNRFTLLTLATIFFLALGEVCGFVPSPLLSEWLRFPDFIPKELTPPLQISKSSTHASILPVASIITSNTILSASAIPLYSSSLLPSFSPSAIFSSGSIKRKIIASSSSGGNRISLLEPIGNGTFGQVYWARDDVTGRKLVAKTARATTPEDERAQHNAQSYLEIEAYINSKLCPVDQISDDRVQHVAPYLGEYTINGTTYLIWDEAGEYTLEDYIQMKGGWVQLAMDLGIDIDDDDDIIGADERNVTGNDERDQNQKEKMRQTLAKELLEQLLEGLAYCHSRGVVHRDIKPANILVDQKTHTLRLIDFGSACCMSSWTANKLGYRGDNKGVRSILYCAPEEFVNEEYPYAFDMYSAAITWVRTILSGDSDNYDGESTDCKSDDVNKSQATFGLGSEEHLFQWRLAVRDFGHNLIAWEEYATSHDCLPYGWYSLFGSSRQGIQALRLLSNMMSYAPERRMSASEALLGQYLNPGCNAATPPDLPPAMPWSIMSHIQRWKKDKQVHSWQDEECRIDDLFTEVVAVELGLPLGLTLEARKDALKKNGDGAGVVVAVVHVGTDAEMFSICSGDQLLAIGAIDVENASLDHVQEILSQWPRRKKVPMLFLRDF